MDPLHTVLPQRYCRLKWTNISRRGRSPQTAIRLKAVQGVMSVEAVQGARGESDAQRGEAKGQGRTLKVKKNNMNKVQRYTAVKIISLAVPSNQAGGRKGNICVLDCVSHTMGVVNTDNKRSVSVRQTHRYGLTKNLRAKFNRSCLQPFYPGIDRTIRLILYT